MPNLISVLSNLHEEAAKSTLQQHLAAAVVHNNKQLSNSVCNVDRNLCRGHYTPSLHAEARALLSYYGRSIHYSKYKGWTFNDPDYKPKKVDVAVIRVTRSGDMANSRPCRKCLSMMRNLGIKRVHYSTGIGDEIITENIKDMYSIQDSSSARYFERLRFNYPKNDLDYYKLVLKKSAPNIIKRHSLDHFIRFNLKELLPSCNYSYVSKNGKEFFKIEDDDGFVIIIRVQ